MKLKLSLKIASLFVFTMLIHTMSARADGLIVIHDPPHHVPGHFRFAPLEVISHKVDVDITDVVAKTSIDQDFYNPNNARLEGTYIFPLPGGAHIDKFSMDINGKQMQAELLPADKARALYEEIVRKQKDPALLEYIGRGAYKVRIFPIEPKSHKRIKISYTELLKSDSGLTEYVYPLNTEKFSSVPIKDVSVRVTINTKDALKTVYSPSHNVEISRHGQNKAVIGYEEKNGRPDTDFKVLFSRTPKPLGIDLLTFRNSGEDGYFLLMASPGQQKPGKTQPKDICFVVDTSGSMADGKLKQAKKALQFCLANLNDDDRFEIIRFSTEAEPFFDKLADASKDNIEKAEQFVDDFKPIGGTVISEALKEALSLNRDKDDSGRPYIVVFLTDGLPTIGEMKEDKIIDMVKDGNTRMTRIFSFGIGSDVNTHLLDRLAEGTRAISQYVLEEEDLELKLSSFYRKIKEPVLTDVSVTVEGSRIRLTQLYPSQLPDIFNGDMLTIFGRYKGKGHAAITVSGMMHGKKRSFTDDVHFPKNDTRNEFVPRLWATRRVGWLLDEIRRNGETAEVRDEVTQLARKFGIVTPYTAYLILEDEARRNVPVARRNFLELERDRPVGRRVASSFSGMKREASDEKYRSGAEAVDNAVAVQQLKAGRNMQQSVWGKGMAKQSAPASTGYRTAKNYISQTRVISGRAFYQNGSNWVDSTAQAKKDIRQVNITFNSKAYFALINDHPKAAPWFALGREVDVVLDNVLYQVR